MKFLTYSEAIKELKKYKGDRNVGIARKAWDVYNESPVIKFQVPDDHSFMTEEYFYMERFTATGRPMRYPINPSSESTKVDDWHADDWYIVDEREATPQPDLFDESSTDSAIATKYALGASYEECAKDAKDAAMGKL